MAKVKINKTKLKDAGSLLRALAHPLRLRIVHFIDKRRKVNVNKIYHSLKLEQSITSQHLKILRDSNIVIAKRSGKFIMYEVNYKRLSTNMKYIHTFLAKKRK